MFPSDIARWALGGRQPDEANDGTNNESSNEEAAPSSSSAPLSEEDVRARRMARLAALENTITTNNTTTATEDTAMEEVDKKDKPSSSSSMDIDKPTASPPTTTSEEPAAKKQATKQLSPADKLLRRKNLLLKKILLVTLTRDNNNNATISNGGGAVLDLQLNTVPSNWDQSHLAEILATRLSIDRSDSRLRLGGGGQQNYHDLIGYLCGCYKRAYGEWKELREKKNSKRGGVGRKSGDDCNNAGGDEELEAILVEMRTQVSFSLFVEKKEFDGQ